MEKDEAIAKIVKAAREGKVHLMTDGIPLVSDGDAELSLITAMQLPGAFALSLSDGGGFSSILLSYNCWEKMKEIVDTYIKETKENEQLG